MRKGNYFKRILAGSLALMTVAGYVSADASGFIKSGVGIVANAAETKAIGYGIRYKSGDTIDFGEGAYIRSTWGDIEAPNDGYDDTLDGVVSYVDYNKKFLTGTKSFTFFFKAGDGHYYCSIEGFGDYNLKDDGIDTPVTCMEIRGSGTENDPYYGIMIHEDSTVEVHDSVNVNIDMNSSDYAVVNVEPENGVYTFEAGNTYTIYSKKTLTTENSTGLTISQSAGATYNDVEYAYKYAITVSDNIEATSYTFSHVHDIVAYGYDASNPDADKNKVYVKCTGEEGTVSSVAASVDTKDVYYYGQMPTESDIVLYSPYGAEVTPSDFYVTRKGDPRASHLDINDLNFDSTYIVNTVIHVVADGKGYDFNIKKEFKYAPRPLYECNVYYKDADGVEHLLDKNGGENPYDTVTFGYDEEEKSPSIIFRNPYNDDVLTLDNEIFIAEGGQTKGTESGKYNFSIQAAANTDEFINNYAESMSFNWWIAPASMTINAEFKGKIYDGIQIDKDDFTFSGKHAPLLSSDDTSIDIKFGYEKADSTIINALSYANTLLANGGNETEIAQVLVLANGYLNSLIGKTIETNLVLNENDYFQFGSITLNGENILTNDSFNTANIPVRDNEVLLLKDASFIDGVLNMAIEIVEKAPETDGTSAGNHTAIITIKNPNYLDTVIKIPAEITKRSVSITPDKEQGIVYSTEEIPSISYTVEAENDETNSGFIADDLTAGQTESEFFGDLIKVNKYTDNTDAEVYFSYTGGKNNAGKYDYAFKSNMETYIGKTVPDVYSGLEPAIDYYNIPLQLGWIKNGAYAGYNNVDFGMGCEQIQFNYARVDASDINGVIEVHLDSLDGDVIATCETKNTESWYNVNTFTCDIDKTITGKHNVYMVFKKNSEDENCHINFVSCKLIGADPTEFDNYNVELVTDEYFTVAPRELTTDMFRFTSDSVLVYNEDAQDAPEYAFNDGTFTDGSSRLTADDFEVGGPNQAVFPNTYSREFYGKGNYTGSALLEWSIVNDASNTVYVTAEGFTYDGKTADEHNTVTVTNRNSLPEGSVLKYHYYKADQNTVLDNITADTVAELEEVSSPSDYGTYIVEVTASKKGYTINSGYASFSIAKDVVYISVEQNEKIFGAPDPIFTYTTISEGKEVTGILSLKSFDGQVLYNADGSIASYEFDTSDLDVVINGEVNKNYNIVTESTFRVIPRRLFDADIIPGKSIIDETTGWALTQNGFKVSTVGVDGNKVILTPGRDFTIITAAKTKLKGDFSIQIKGKGNYKGYAENTISIVTPDEAGYHVSVVNGTLANGDTEGLFNDGAVCVVNADEAPEGYKFGYWTKNGVTISYNSTYTFYVTSDNVEIEAVYVENTDDIERYGSAKIEYGDVEDDGEKTKLVFVSSLSVPNDCTILKAGIVATNQADMVNDLTVDNAESIGYNRYAENPGVHNYEYTWKKSVTTADETWYVKGYVLYTDANGNEKVVYSRDVIKASLNGYEVIEEENIVGTSKITGSSVVDGNKLQFVSFASVPADCTINAVGIVATSNAEKAQNLTTENADFFRTDTNVGYHNYQYTWTKTNVTADQVWYVKGYLVYTDNNTGKTYTVYSELASDSLPNS